MVIRNVTAHSRIRIREEWIISSRVVRTFSNCMGLKLIQEFSTELRVGIKVVSKMFQINCQDREKCSSFRKDENVRKKFQSYISQSKIKCL